MRTRLVAVNALALAIVGCQIVAGLQSRQADPVQPGCVLPALGDGKIRVANLVPNTDVVDFCLRPAGGASYGRPVLAGNYTQCPAGFAYADMSGTFGAPTGSIDVKAIPYGSDCGAAPIAEAKGIATRTDASVTIALMGAGSGERQLVAVTDTVGAPEGLPKFRFVNAVAGSAPMAVGFTKLEHLPADIVTPVTSKGVAFTEQTCATNLSVPFDANGYFTYPGARYSIGAGPFGETRASVLGILPGNGSRTMYAIGSPSDLEYPVRGLLCEDKIDVDGEILASCVPTELPVLTIDSFSAGFMGAGKMYLSARYGPTADTVAQRTSDIVCLSTIELAPKALVLDKAKQSFPYIYSPETDISTPVTDPRDKNGVVPPPPTAPPCSGTVTQSDVDAVISCFAQNCSTTGDASGVLDDETAGCISVKCTGALTPLYVGDRDHLRCFQCLLEYTLDYDHISTAEAACTTDPRSIIGHGTSSVALLSKLPIVESDILVMPTALNPRRNVLFSRVQLEPRQPDKVVDVYCGEFDNPDNYATFHYTGDYAAPDSPNGFVDEELLQADKMLAFIKQKSGSRPAIIVGNWHSSLRYPADPQTPSVVDDAYPDTMKKLRAALIPAEPPGFTPRCTACVTPENPYRATNKGRLFTNGAFLYNLDPKATVDAFRSFDQMIVPLPDNQLGTTMGPLAPEFGWTVQIIRPQ